MGGFSGSLPELGEARRRVRLDLLREHLSAGVEALRARHEEGASGEEFVRVYAAFMRDFLGELWVLADGDARAEGYDIQPVVLMALGGFGRGELHPSSDIDIMITYERQMGPHVQMMAQELLYTLWDLGLQVGHSCRSLTDCLAIARTDFPSRTSMLAASWIAGDRALFRTFRRTLRDNLYRKDFAEFLATTLAERDQRYRKHGGSPYLGEPNVKESAGGLRDLHTAMWLASTKFGTRTLRELEDKGLITPRERRATDEALAFLWRVRNELHFLAGHKNDVLSRSLQVEIARNFGYAADERTLGVGRFMREYYLHARTVHRVSARLIARCQETLSRRRPVLRRLRQKGMAEGFGFYDGQVHLTAPPEKVFAKDPIRLMKVFWHAHQLGYELGVEVARAVEESLPLVDDGFRASPEARDLFFAILRNWGRVTPTLRLMHDLGFLGAYLPEFGELTCLVQLDAYHKYTADQHSLLAVENLEGLAPGQSAESEEQTQRLAELPRPEILILGVLLHDIGKGRGHGHVARGVEMIKGAIERLNLALPDARALTFLVAEHLLLSQVAQRRDLDDPKTIDLLTEVVGDPEWLTMLYLLTWADTKAVGPGVMTPWRAAILRELYLKAHARLTGEPRPEVPKVAVVADRVLSKGQGEVERGTVLQHLEGLSERYRATTSPQRIAAHIRLIEQIMEGEVMGTELFHHPDLGYSDLVVVAHDLQGLFALLTGGLAANGVNILSAQIYTREDGIAIDTFQVNDPSGEVIQDGERWIRIVEDLRDILTGKVSVDELSTRRGRGRGEKAQAVPVKVSIENQVSDSHTVIEIKTQDRLGLLYAITRCLASAGLNIAAAKIATESAQVYDAFYVTDREGRKLTAIEQVERVQQSLEEALRGGL